MNLFFYASAQSQLAEHFAAQLLKHKVLASLIVLPAGSQLSSDKSLQLRNDDVLILFAASKQELEGLLAIHDKFEEFRVILILPDRDTELVTVGHVLKPRFISFMDSDMGNLEKVICKMQGLTTAQQLSGNRITS